MKYRVEITDTASAEVEEAWSWLALRSRTAADRWKSALLEAVSRLEKAPLIRGLSPESEYFGREIREMLQGKRPNVYRILYEVRGTVVRVLRVRHSARRPQSDRGQGSD
jgi:plasmid stabilization system protein ParE